MGEVINLNQYRKQRDKTRKADQAAANRVRSGRTKAQRRNEQAGQDRTRRELDGKQREEPS
jgi:hypothetical protein